MEPPSDFIGFLGDLVDGDDLEGPAAGIARKVVDEGWMAGLSQRQHATLIRGVTEWLAENFHDYDPGPVAHGEEPPEPDCYICGDKVPWCEVYAAGTMFNGACSCHNRNDD